MKSRQTPVRYLYRKIRGTWTVDKSISIFFFLSYLILSILIFYITSTHSSPIHSYIYTYIYVYKKINTIIWLIEIEIRTTETRCFSHPVNICKSWNFIYIFQISVSTKYIPYIHRWKIIAKDWKGPKITRIDRYAKSHDEKSSLFKNRYEISLVSINLTLPTNPIPFQCPSFVHEARRRISQHPHFRLTKMFSNSSLVMRRWGLVGLSVGLPYNLLLMAYSLGLSSHLTLNHQSHTNTAWLNCVPFGHRNVAWRPSMSQ